MRAFMAKYSTSAQSLYVYYMYLLFTTLKKTQNARKTIQQVYPLWFYTWFKLQPMEDVPTNHIGLKMEKNILQGVLE